MKIVLVVILAFVAAMANAQGSYNPEQVHVVDNNPSPVHVVENNPERTNLRGILRKLISAIKNDNPTPVHVVDNNPSQVHVVDNNPSQVHVVDNNPSQVHVVDNNPSQVHVVDNNPGQGIIADVDSAFYQPHNPYPPNGGYEPISTGPALVGPYPYPYRPINNGARGGKK